MELVNNSKLYKKFSIGLSLETTVNEYRRLLEQYGLYIYDAYISLPLGNDYHSRRHTITEFSRHDAMEQFYNTLKLMKDHEIKLEIALNTRKLCRDHIKEALDYLESNCIEFDSIVTLKAYGEIIKNRFPDKQLVYSYNNGLRTKEHVNTVPQEFDEVVVGNSCIRNLDLINYINEKGFKCRYLINNGCSFNCYWCTNVVPCESVFIKNIECYTVEELYSFQSVFPWELHKYILNNTNIGIIKISSRPSNYNYIQQCLRSYICNYDRELIEDDYKYYHLWGRLAHFCKYYKTFDFNRITEIKELIWSGQKTFE